MPPLGPATVRPGTPVVKGRARGAALARRERRGHAPRHAEAIYGALPTKPDYVVVPNAGHFAFLACSEEVARRSPAVYRDTPEFDREGFHRQFNPAVVAFFKRHL